MRLFRFAVLAALLAVPVLVAAAPATYAQSTAGAVGSVGAVGAVGTVGAAGAAGAAGALSTIGTPTASAVPSTATPGARTTFSVNCGSLTADGATLFGTTLGLPAQIPMNQNSDGDFSISVDLPRDIQAGTYHPSIDCSGGSSTTATLHVTAFPRAGGAATGDGTTSTTSNGMLAVAGLALVGIGGLAGGFALRRRGTRARG
jgi:type IV secretion system protein TrbL